MCLFLLSVCTLLYFLVCVNAFRRVYVCLNPVGEDEVRTCLTVFRYGCVPLYELVSARLCTCVDTDVCGCFRISLCGLLYLSVSVSVCACACA